MEKESSKKLSLLSTGQKVGFGIGAVGKDMVYMLTASYVMYYYQDLLGISASFVGLILMVARVFDAVNDPFMGVLVAKTNTKHGRFRPWIISGTLLNAFILFGLFAVPQWCTGKILMTYFAVVYILWGMSYTVMDIPFWSMIPAMTETSTDRENMSTIGRSCAGVGSALITIVTMIIVPKIGEAVGGGEREGFKWFALSIAVFFIIAEIVCCLKVKEKKIEEAKAPSIKEMFSSLFKNDQAIAVVVTIVFVNTALYITSNLLIYFFKYDIAGQNWNNSYVLFSTFGGTMQILTMMLFYPLIRKFLSALSVFRFSLIMSIIGYVILFLLTMTGVSKSIYILFIPGFMIFAGNGMLTILTTLFLANSCDYGELKNGRRDESVIFSMQTFVVKLASGLAAFVAGIGIDMIGLVGNDSTTEEIVKQNTSTLFGLRMIMTIIPIVLLVLAFMFFLKKYTLTEERLEEIQEKLKK